MSRSIASRLAAAVECGELPCGRHFSDFIREVGDLTYGEFGGTRFELPDGSALIEGYYTDPQTRDLCLSWVVGLTAQEVKAIGNPEDLDEGPEFAARGSKNFSGYDYGRELLDDVDREDLIKILAWTYPVVAVDYHGRTTGYDYLADAIDDWCDSVVDAVEPHDRALGKLYRKLLHAGHVCSLHGGGIGYGGGSLEIEFGSLSVEFYAKGLDFTPFDSIAEVLRDCESELIDALPALDPECVEVQRDEGKIRFRFYDESELTFDYED